MADSPYAAYHRLQDEAIQNASPYPADRSWQLDEDGTDPVLLIEGDYGVICRLRLGDDGVWLGRWLQFEEMPIELIPLG